MFDDPAFPLLDSNVRLLFLVHMYLHDPMLSFYGGGSSVWQVIPLPLEAMERIRFGVNPTQGLDSRST